jgi:hypothetical protein
VPLGPVLKARFTRDVPLQMEALNGVLCADKRRAAETAARALPVAAPTPPDFGRKRRPSQITPAAGLGIHSDEDSDVSDEGGSDGDEGGSDGDDGGGGRASCPPCARPRLGLGDSPRSPQLERLLAVAAAIADRQVRLREEVVRLDQKVAAVGAVCCTMVALMATLLTK